MPRRRALLVVLELGLDLGRQVEVAVDVLDVVAVFESVDDPENLACSVGVDLDLERGNELDIRRLVVKARLLQRRTHGDEVGCLGDDFESLSVRLDLLGPCLECRHHDVVFCGALTRDDDDSLAVEVVGD